MDRHAAPAGADLDQVVGGLQVELAADAFELAPLRLLQRFVLFGEDRKRHFFPQLPELEFSLTPVRIVGKPAADVFAHEFGVRDSRLCEL